MPPPSPLCQEYTKLIRGIDNYPQEKDIDFVCVDCNPLLTEIQKETRVWITGEGRQLPGAPLGGG